MREIRNYRFLILDDIGTEKNTEFVDKTVYELINYRFEEELQTQKKEVTEELVYEVVSNMTKIPVSKINLDEKNSLIN